ncbi:MAG TPA: DegT/DnrJ/EryC1/StrS family aminotransferase [Trichocoleus sp.]
MTAIPPIDLTQQFKSIQDEVGAAVMQVLASGQYINGPLVEQFARAFGQYVGTSECVVCNSGTDALYLALRALNIGPGDEVITSPFTFIATAEMISAAGATPVFIDIDLATFNLDVQKIEQAITDKTRAIMPVHLFGMPVDMTAVMALAERYNLAVIEDCAQSTGALWQGQQVGSIGHVGAFSFFPTKNLGGCGDGGALTTNDPKIAETSRIIREHGSRVRYYHEAIGINSRLDAVQAVILEIKLRYLDEWNARRAAVAEEYERLLAPIPGVITPQPIAGGTPVWNQYTIRLEAAEQDGAVRDRIRQHMQSQGVLPMVYYPIPLHQQSVYAHLGYAPGSLPMAEQASRQVLSLPMFPELGLEQQAQVVYSLKEALVQAID